MTTLLLDTCACIWLGDGARMRPTALSAIATALETQSAHVSPFTAWEMSLLASRGRLNFTREVGAWFETLVSKRGFVLAPLPVSVLIAAHTLPGSPPNDPADRILIATAREFGHAIVTRDHRILDYGVAGLVQTVPC
ncbi:MAG: type II toxin-antitoxin system VapC family toxin [Alphaproteobacteria bacterium]